MVSYSSKQTQSELFNILCSGSLSCLCMMFILKQRWTYSYVFHSCCITAGMRYLIHHRLCIQTYWTSFRWTSGQTVSVTAERRSHVNIRTHRRDQLEACCMWRELLLLLILLLWLSVSPLLSPLSTFNQISQSLNTDCIS